jgi:hypothetical protein
LYEPFFRDNADLHGEITNRIGIGAFVIDEERSPAASPHPSDLIDHVGCWTVCGCSQIRASLELSTASAAAARAREVRFVSSSSLPATLTIEAVTVTAERCG